MTDGKSTRTGNLRVLKSEVRSDIETARHLAKEAADMFHLKSEPRPNETIYATALLLHHFYSAFESAFERIAKALDGDLPSGVDWHRQLLQRMALDIDDVRPAVLSPSAVVALDEYRRFRDVVRHAYQSPLQEDRLQRLVEQLPTVLQATDAAVGSFMSFLNELIARL